LIGFTQIAGLVARRIVPFVKTGRHDRRRPAHRPDSLWQPGRDVYLPVGTEPSVLWGRRSSRAETVLATIGQQR